MSTTGLIDGPQLDDQHGRQLPHALRGGRCESGTGTGEAIEHQTLDDRDEIRGGRGRVGRAEGLEQGGGVPMREQAARELRVQFGIAEQFDNERLPRDQVVAALRQ
ncbi:hypothetical protein GL309_35170 [Nocardia seriolae]|nr:hypothetical protein [Nocardia seriolae]MTJ70638.1 hypothetical protein [Nocardia seriolae]